VKCPNCGRLDFEASEICPRCGEPMPPGSGEHSTGSREQPAVSASKTPAPPAPGPLFSPPPASAVEPQEDKKPLKTEKLEPKPEPDHARVPIPPEPDPIGQSTSKPDSVEEKRPTPPAPKDPPTGQEAQPLKPKAGKNGGEIRRESGTWSSDNYKRAASGSSGSRPKPQIDTMYPPSDFVEKARARVPTPPTRPTIREGGKIVPESYAHDSATFSSELSTDWIEKYARVHVTRMPDTAGIGVRIWAFVIDWLLLTAMGVVILLAGRLVVTILDGRQYTPIEMLRILALPVGGVWVVAIMFYMTIFTAASGQTPGKLAMDLRVFYADGHPPSLPRAALRSLIYILGIIPLGAGLWWVFSNNQRRALHDIAAGTSVLTVYHKKK